MAGFWCHQASRPEFCHPDVVIGFAFPDVVLRCLVNAYFPLITGFCWHFSGQDQNTGITCHYPKRDVPLNSVFEGRKGGKWSDGRVKANDVSHWVTSRYVCILWKYIWEFAVHAGSFKMTQNDFNIGLNYFFAHLSLLQEQRVINVHLKWKMQQYMIVWTHHTYFEPLKQTLHSFKH